MLSQTVVHNAESDGRFKELIANLHELFHPENEVELDCVEKMAVSRWRQQRLWVIDKATFAFEERRQLAADPELANEDAPTRTSQAFRWLADNSRCLDLMNRYEARFDREFHRAHARLVASRAEKT